MIWKPKRNRANHRATRSEAVRRRSPSPERLELRRLLAADPIHVGVVYLETDYLESDQDVGSDSRGDRFILSFTGGAPDTELAELRLRTDKDGDGITVGDPIYDTAQGGRGKQGAHGFEVIRVSTSDGREIDAVAEVADGGQELVLRLSNFRAGDRLEFTIDVDEVLRNAIDIAIFNDRLDVITSGQEFQDSILEATFEAPHYESTDADAVFLNDYGDPAGALGLDLPADEGDGPSSRPDRSAAAVATALQQPKPIEIGGHVWLDNNLDLDRQSQEPLLQDVEMMLWKFDPFADRYIDTGLRSVTDEGGRYLFSKSLGIPPGQYRVTQSQPAGLLSVGAVSGDIDGVPVGNVESVNAIADIDVPLGDSSALNFDFAEAQLASISGFVFRDTNDDGVRDAGELGIAGVQIQLVPINTISPQSVLSVRTTEDGSYTFTGLAPGQYEVIEVVQPADLADGKDSPGTVDGQVVGVADQPGDRISQIVLQGASVGIEYNFGERPLGSLSGYVYLASPGEDCTEVHDTTGNVPLADVQLAIQNEAGQTVARTRTATDGSYKIENLPVGVYRILQFTPNGLVDGAAHSGRIDGVEVGTVTIDGLIEDISLTSGDGVGYNFCEESPASVAGFVFHDRSNDGSRDQNEEGIAGAEVRLINAAGSQVASATTDAAGRYQFMGLLPGEYSIVESQPAGFLDGIDTVGQIRGQSVGRIDGNDTITSIQLRQGDDAVEYNFGEILPAVLSGRVHVDLDDDCTLDAGEQTLGGVAIRLLDEANSEVARTTTNDQGEYQFANIVPGTYTIVQEQPNGVSEGGAVPGNLGGNAETPSRVTSITLASGEVAFDYDFCERPLSEIVGSVFGDDDGDCFLDPGETGIEGVTVQLYDDSGSLVGSTTTDPSGAYRFADLSAGEYTVREIQPSGWFHGGQHAGSGGGDDTQADVVSAIPVGWGQRLTGYDFCELAAASLSGSVWHESQPNQQFDPGDVPVAGVIIELMDGTGSVIDTTTTDADGKYHFRSLEPGIYWVREVQPTDLFHGGQLVGSAGGNVGGDDLLTGIELTPGSDAVDYNFPEVPPAALSGFVFQDGEAIERDSPPDPRDLREYSDGRLDQGDHRIAGVTIELRDSRGARLDGGIAMPGVYPDGPIHTVTDSNGYYEFWGLPPGIYHVYQVQPDGYIDGLDTPGTAGGLAVNAADEIDDADRATIETLSLRDATDPRSDAILNVALAGGESSEQNNFSELVIVEPEPVDLAEPAEQPLIQWIPPRTPQASFTRNAFLESPTIEKSLNLIRLTTFAASPPQKQILHISDEWAVSWHLSVINAGFPRGTDDLGGIHRSVSARKSQTDWDENQHAAGHWTIVGQDGLIEKSSSMSLGEENAIALAGDFDGDGLDEAAIFVEGRWYVDLNGNGRWDAGDLWIGLGTALDRPVVGDWDGDGKDDIGIFGRKWRRDPQRIRRDPGLPDPDNLRRRGVDMRRMAVAAAQQAGEDENLRLLRRGDAGSLRADAVDHVFQYGEQVDTPLAGDWNGDGIDQIAIFREGQWLLDADGDGRWTSRDPAAIFGQPGDEPIVGDFDGDEIDEIAVVRGDVWIIDTDGDRRITANDLHIQVPRPSENSQPVVGDFDGDGKDDPGYYDEAA